MMWRGFLVILIGLWLSSCGSRPSYVISESKMADIIADMHIAEAAIESDYQNWGTDSAKMAMKQLVCRRHDVTVEDLDTSLVWYGRHLDKYGQIYDKAHKILEKKIAQARKEGGELQATQFQTSSNLSYGGSSNPQSATAVDSMNVYQGVAVMRLSENMPSQVLSFALGGDRDWERGDIYTFSCQMRATRGPLGMDIAVDYADGSTEYVSGRFGQEGRQAITLVLDSTKSATNVYGSLNYTPMRGEVSYLDSVAVTRTRNHDNNRMQRLRYPSRFLQNR